MHEANFIIREPVLDPKQRLIGFELSWQYCAAEQEEAAEHEPDALVSFVAEQFNDPDKGWLFSDNLLFFEATPALLSMESLQIFPAKNTVLILNNADFADPSTIGAVTTLRQQGFGIALRDADLLTLDKGILALITHVEVSFGTANFDAQVHFCDSSTSDIRLLIRNVKNWEEFEVCTSFGLDVCVGAGQFYAIGRQEPQAKALNPGQAMILQLMEMVRKNADVRQLEDVLKRDAAIAYKLLRYINSAGFGLGTEIQSLRHAVTMLGYSPLYRWLSVLLATANASGQSQVLMQTAIVRGRFAELLGKGFLPKNESENLFVTGMFSMLDQLLGIPMEEVLENIQLSESVSQALLSREGIYGPFLALAESCELNNGLVEPHADAVFISAHQINEAHLASLAWAQTLKL